MMQSKSKLLSFKIQKTKDLCAVKTQQMHCSLNSAGTLSLTESKVLLSGCLHLISAHMAEYTNMSIYNSCVLYVFMIEQKNISERSNKRATP